MLLRLEPQFLGGILTELQKQAELMAKFGKLLELRYCWPLALHSPIISYYDVTFLPDKAKEPSPDIA